MDGWICRFSFSKDKFVLWGNQSMLPGPGLVELTVAIRQAQSINTWNGQALVIPEQTSGMSSVRANCALQL